MILIENNMDPYIVIFVLLVSLELLYFRVAV
jgi:hypothetical protein